MINHIVKIILLSLIVANSYGNIPKDTLVMAWRIDDIISLDPAEVFEVSGVEYVDNTYDKLISYNQEYNESNNNDINKFIGIIAKNWTISKDGKTYTFYLHDNIKFASGNYITAYDVKYSIDRVILLNRSPAFILTQFGFSKDNLSKSVKVIDKHTISLTTSTAFSKDLFFNCLTTIVGSIVEKKLLVAHQIGDDFGNTWLKSHYAGSGAYKLKSWKPNQVLSLTSNSNYWGDAPKLKRVIIRHVAEVTTQQLLLEKGDVDVARNVLIANMSNKLKSIPVLRGNLYYLGLNQKNKYLRHPKVIEAIKWLVDYNGIVSSIFKDQFVVHQSFIPKSTLNKTTKKSFELNINNARKLLKDAGFEDGFSVTINTKNIELAQILKESFAKVNIHLEIIPGDSKHNLTKYRARKHDIFIGIWSTDYNDPHANASTFAFNPNNNDDSKFKTVAWRNFWHNQAINKKTSLALTTRSTDVRNKLYKEIDQTLQKESPLVFMFQALEIFSMRSNIQGFTFGPSVNSTIYRHVYKS